MAGEATALLCAAILALAAPRGQASTGEPQHFWETLWGALAITLSFALLAWVARGVTMTGALAGASVAFVFIRAAHDLRMFGVLLVVFAVTLAATRAGGARKQRLRVRESDRGRSASQVMANLGVAGLAMVIPNFGPGRLLALAALAELAADTTSSEIGTAFSSRTILITSWKPVKAGTDGGLSVAGTTAAVVGAALVSACARGLGLASTGESAIIGGAALVGMLVDSLLGASLERRGYIGNNLVNLLGTAAAALLARAWLAA